MGDCIILSAYFLKRVSLTHIFAKVTSSLISVKINKSHVWVIADLLSSSHQILQNLQFIEVFETWKHRFEQQQLVDKTIREFLDTYIEISYIFWTIRGIVNNKLYMCACVCMIRVKNTKDLYNSKSNIILTHLVSKQYKRQNPDILHRSVYHVFWPRCDIL